MIIEPYEHDCKECKWVGWAKIGTHFVNIYICKGKTVVIRYSSEPSDYYSITSYGGKPSPIEIL